MLIVQKFGGTSVGDTGRIKNVARIIAEQYNLGHKLVIVVSAMAGVTNQLISFCADITALNNSYKSMEYDAVLSTGETVSASLLALALQELNIPSCSLQAWQLPIYTTDKSSQALIEDIDISLLNQLIENKIVPVVTGFQGLSHNKRITTLGRGGSDTSAAAIAAALKADLCDIYTDVDGVYSADPRLVHDAKLIKILSYEEMLELAGVGAKVLHPRCVEIGMRYRIPIRIISSFTQIAGTIIMNNINEINKVTGITYLKNLTKVELKNPRVSFNNFVELCAINNLHFHQLLKIGAEEIIFTIQADQITNLNKMIAEQEELFEDITIQPNLCSIAIIGAGIRHDTHVLVKILNILQQHHIKFLYLTNSEIKVSLIVKNEEAESTTKLLHQNLIHINA